MRSFLLNSGIKGLLDLLRQRKILITFFIYLAISFFILFKTGINTGGEATKYIEDANRLLNGQPLRVNFFSNFYIVYSLLVAAFIKLNLSFKFIAIIQIILSFLSACCIYKISLYATNNVNVSFTGIVIYLISFPIQQWNFYLYTESLHVSLTVIGLYFLYSLFQKLQKEKVILFLVILFFIVFSRPVGILFLSAAILTMLIWLIKNKKKILFYSLLSLLLLMILFLFQSDFSFYFNPDSLRRMEIICQVSEINKSVSYKEYNTSGLHNFLKIIFEEIGVKNFLILGFKKLGYFFGMIRSFYSSTHNAILLFTETILYPLALIGFFFLGNKSSFYLKLFSLTYIFITSIGIFFTCDEWSNRFVAPVFPHLIILAGLGIYFLKNKFYPQKKSVGY